MFNSGINFFKKVKFDYKYLNSDAKTEDFTCEFLTLVLIFNNKFFKNALLQCVPAISQLSFSFTKYHIIKM